MRNRISRRPAPRDELAHAPSLERVRALRLVRFGEDDDHDVALTTPFRKLAPETDAPDVPAPEPAPAPIAPVSADPRWERFEEIGLGARPSLSSRAAKLVVSSYRVIGFGVLTIVVIALVGYIATSLFYLGNRTWIVPVVVSASDEKVVAQRAELAAQRNERDRIAGVLRDAERVITEQLAFQAEFTKAIRSDLDQRQAALGQLRSLARKTARTRGQIRDASDAYASSHEAQMAEEYDAGLIDRDALVAGKYQLAQLATSKLSLAERQHVLRAQAEELASQARALDAVLAGRDAEVPLTYEVLTIKRDYDASKLALARAIETRNALQASLARQDEVLTGLAGSAYLRALDDGASVALVPYANLEGVRAGTPLHACRLEMLWCRQVGSVLAVLPGEVRFAHPHRDTTARGQLIELRLTEAKAAHDDVLFVGGKPLGF